MEAVSKPTDKQATNDHVKHFSYSGLKWRVLCCLAYFIMHIPPRFFQHGSTADSQAIAAVRVTIKSIASTLLFYKVVREVFGGTFTREERCMCSSAMHRKFK